MLHHKNRSKPRGRYDQNVHVASSARSVGNVKSRSSSGFRMELEKTSDFQHPRPHGRIPKMDLPKGFAIYAIGILDSRNRGSTFSIVSGIWVGRTLGRNAPKSKQDTKSPPDHCSSAALDGHHVGSSTSQLPRQLS